MVRRQSLRRKSTLSSLLFGEDEAEALKSKNIKQTELVAALREAIARTAEHFHCLDPRHSSTVSSHCSTGTVCFMPCCGLWINQNNLTGALREPSLHSLTCQTMTRPSILTSFWPDFSHLVSLGPDSWLLNGEPPARSRKLSCGVSQPTETGKGFAGLWATRWWWAGLQEEWHNHCKSWLAHRRTQTSHCLLFPIMYTHCTYALTSDSYPTVFLLSFCFRSSHRRMNTVGLESSMALEVCVLFLRINTHCCPLGNWLFYNLQLIWHTFSVALCNRLVSS